MNLGADLTVKNLQEFLKKICQIKVSKFPQRKKIWCVQSVAVINHIKLVR